MLCTQATGKLRAAGLLLCLTGIAVAQNTPQNTWIRVTTVKVKPEMVQEWREIEKNEIMPAYKKANVPAYAVWQTSLFGDAYEYNVVVPVRKFEQFDGDSPFVKTMKPEDRVRLGYRLTKCIVSSHSSALLMQADTSVIKDGAAMPDLIMVSQIQLQPKNVNAYLSYLKEEIKPVMQKAGVDWWLVYRDIFGAERTQITTVRSMKNWAEIDAGPVTRRLLSPPEYTRVTDKGNALVESTTISMGHLVKDLSY
ncbi:MAG: hypothetical protein WAJ87_20440 [Bryobacteraceae bacterium]